MDNIRKTPLAERIRGASRTDLPRAISLTARDFLGIAGEITGQEERYEKLYQTRIAPHDKKGDIGKLVCELAVEADTMAPGDRDNILFWLLIEPFANMDETERGK